MKRREFTKLLSASSLSLMTGASLFQISEEASENDKLSVSIFSKHLQFLDYENTGKMAKALGFDGVDLTVRPKGHVLPENVKTDLPKAVEAIQKGGSICEMMTTNIEGVHNDLGVDILETAADLGIKYYRTNWFKYPRNQSMPDALKVYQKQIKKLGNLNKKLGIIGNYQNHTGTKVGASYWEIDTLLKTVNTDYFGVQYDIRHAVAESGKAWSNGLQLLHSNIKIIVLKDFKWEIVEGKTKLVNVPIGEGMVDFDKYFKLLKKYGLNPPVSLHLEYGLDGAEKGKPTISVSENVVYDAMKKDLNKIQEMWAKA